MKRAGETFKIFSCPWLLIPKGGWGGGEERGLECNLTERCPFFKNLHNPFRKKLHFDNLVSELLSYMKFQKQYGKQQSIVLENNSILFLNK